MLKSRLIEQFGQMSRVGVKLVIGSDLVSLYLLGCYCLHYPCLFFQLVTLSQLVLGRLDGFAPLLVPPPVLEATITRYSFLITESHFLVLFLS